MEIARKNAGGTGVEVTWHDYRRKFRHHQNPNQKKTEPKNYLKLKKINDFWFGVRHQKKRTHKKEQKNRFWFDFRHSPPKRREKNEPKK